MMVLKSAMNISNRISESNLQSKRTPGWIWLLAILLLVGCTAKPLPNSSAVSPTASSTSNIPVTPSTATSLDLSPFLRAHSILASLGNKVWPDFGTTPPPYLVQVGSDDLLLGNATPPPTVVPILGLTFLEVITVPPGN